MARECVSIDAADQGTAEDSEGPGLGEGHWAGVREGAPPPTPPRANYARRGENSIARDGHPCASAEALTRGLRAAPSPASGRGYIGTDRSDRSAAEFSLPHAVCAVCGEGRGGGRPRTQSDDSRRAPILRQHQPPPAVSGEVGEWCEPGGGARGSRRSFRLSSSRTSALRTPHSALRTLALSHSRTLALSHSRTPHSALPPAPLRLQGLPAGRRSYKIQRSANLPLRPPQRRSGAPRCAGRAPPPVCSGTSSRIRNPQPVPPIRATDIQQNETISRPNPYPSHGLRGPPDEVAGHDPLPLKRGFAPRRDPR
jgi:hypothetical protein